MKYLSILAFALVLVIQNSCTPTRGGHDFPPTPRIVYMLEIRWGLTSATSIPNLSTGQLHNYQGTPGDSLNFGYALTPNIGNYSFTSSLKGVTNYVPIDTIITATNVLPSDTSRIAYDVLALASPWMPSYGDTLFLTKASPSALVFQVSYSDSLGKGVEVDSFHIIGTH